jgi:nitroreductase
MAELMNKYMEIINNLISPGLLERKSILSFSDKPVEFEKIKLLFEAARWAPSSLNLQPWRFIYATKEDTENYSKLFDLLFDGNKIWAYTAPLLVLSCTEKTMEYKSKPNRFAFYDLGMAVGNLLVQATYMGLFVHQMGGFDFEKARLVLDIPERFEPAAMIAIGYKGEIEKMSPDLQQRELRKRERRDFDEFVYKGSWEVKT